MMDTRVAESTVGAIAWLDAAGLEILDVSNGLGGGQPVLPRSIVSWDGCR